MQNNNMFFVGITMRYKKTSDSKEFGEKFVIHKSFSDLFENSDLPIVLLPICSLKNIDFIADKCIGVILTGSAQNVNPKYYGDKAFDEEQDYDEYLFTKEVISAFKSKNKGLLGVCYGAQALNVYYGGTLHNVKNHVEVKHPLVFTEFANKDNGLFEEVLEGIDDEHILVNSYHQQAINSLAPSLKPFGIFEDGVVEIYQKDNKIIRIQFHPEVDFGTNQYIL